LRVLITSEIRLYRDGLARVLSQLSDIAAVATCETAAECLVADHNFGPDVILLDMSMAGSAGAARLLTRQEPSVKIVALAVPETEQGVLACVEAGISGYVPREGSIDDLVSAIRHSVRGEAVCSPTVTAELMRRVALHAQYASATRQLTARELEIAERLGLGMSNRVIASSLGIELCTVKNHVHHILEKLGVSRRSDVVEYLNG